jgi:hypothetical protein
MATLRMFVTVVLVVVFLASCTLPPPPMAQPDAAVEAASLAEIEEAVIAQHNLRQPLGTWGMTPFEAGLPYVLPGMDRVEVQEIVFRTVDGDPTEMRVYYPPDLAADAKVPAIIQPNAWDDAKFIESFGMDAWSNPWPTYWSLLFAADGYVTIGHSAEHQDDLEVLMEYVVEHADELRIDADRIGFVNCCAPALMANSYANQLGHENIKFQVILYGAVAANNQELFELWVEDSLPHGLFYDFPLFDEFRPDLPMLIVRTGQHSEPWPNDLYDYFVPLALEQNLDLTLINFPEGFPGFDVEIPDAPRTQQIFAAILAFMRDSLERQ